MKVLRAAPLAIARISLALLAFVTFGWEGRLLSPATAAASQAGTAPAAVASFVEAYNKHDLKAIMALVADNFVELFPDGNYVGGKDAERSTLTSVFAGSPHVTMVMDHLVGDDLTAAAQVSIVSEPPKGQPPAAQYAYFFSVADGKILAIAVYARSAQAQKEAGAKP